MKKPFLIWAIALITFIVAERLVVAACPSCVMTIADYEAKHNRAK